MTCISWHRVISEERSEPLSTPGRRPSFLGTATTCGHAFAGSPSGTNRAHHVPPEKQLYVVALRSRALEPLNETASTSAALSLQRYARLVLGRVKPVAGRLYGGELDDDNVLPRSLFFEQRTGRSLHVAEPSSAPAGAPSPND